MNLRLAYRVVRWWPPSQQLAAFSELRSRARPGTLHRAVTEMWLDKVRRVVADVEPSGYEDLVAARPELLDSRRGWR